MSNENSVLHATQKQVELGHELVLGAMKNVTETANLTLDLAYSLFNSKTKFSVQQQADAILWCTSTGDFVEVADRNDYIHDLCVEFGSKAYTLLIDQKNTIKESPEVTSENPDYESYNDQITAVKTRMKDAVKVLAGFVFLRNNGNTTITVQKSKSSVHKFVQCIDASGEFHKYNKSGMIKLSPKSVTVESNTRETEMSGARKQGLLLAIVGLNEAIRNDDRTLKSLKDFKDKTEIDALVTLMQDLNTMCADNQSMIEDSYKRTHEVEETLKKKTATK